MQNPIGGSDPFRVESGWPSAARPDPHPDGQRLPPTAFPSSAPKYWGQADYGTVKHTPPGRVRPARTLFNSSEIAFLYFVPAGVSMFIFVLYANVYHRAGEFVLSLSFAASIIFAAFAFFHKGDSFRFLMYAFCTIAAVGSTGIGLLCYHMVLAEYWFLYDSNTYTNVMVDESAKGFADAGKLIFVEGTGLDVDKSVGYKDGSVYCVAPVIDDTNPPIVEFWAVGKDCCDSRGAFVCDDAWDSKAHAGVVVHEILEEYNLARKMAEAQFGLASSERPLFLRWVVDPQTVETNLWRVGVGIMLIGLLVQHLILDFVAWVINKGKRIFMPR